MSTPRKSRVLAMFTFWIVSSRSCDPFGCVSWNMGCARWFSWMVCRDVFAISPFCFPLSLFLNFTRQLWHRSWSLLPPVIHITPMSWYVTTMAVFVVGLTRATTERYVVFFIVVIMNCAFSRDAWWSPSNCMPDHIQYPSTKCCALVSGNWLKKHSICQASSWKLKQHNHWYSTSIGML